MYKKPPGQLTEDNSLEPPTTIWPEWVALIITPKVEQEVNSEKYSTKHTFEDSEGV
jgi:hypothetical protein